MSGFMKFDGGKLRFDLIPPRVLTGLVKALTYGAKKYAEWNFRRGANWGRYFGATNRHLWAFWQGDNFDICAEHNGNRPPDCKECSGNHHLDHALASMVMLYDSVLENRGVDDRPILVQQLKRWAEEELKKNPPNSLEQALAERFDPKKPLVLNESAFIGKKLATDCKNVVPERGFEACGKPHTYVDFTCINCNPSLGTRQAYEEG